MGKKEQRLEAPMLRNYLRDLPRHSSFAPEIPGWLPWLVFFAVASGLSEFIIEPVALALAVGAALSVRWLVGMWFRPRNRAEESEKAYFDSVRRLRTLAMDGRIRRHVPEPVLESLEKAAVARAAAAARLVGEHHTMAEPNLEEIETAMRAAIKAALPVVRPDEQGRREWQALCKNEPLIEAIVSAIQIQEAKMGGPSEALNERLAALRELDDLHVHPTATKNELG